MEPEHVAREFILATRLINITVGEYMFDERIITHRVVKGHRYPILTLPVELVPADQRIVRLVRKDKGFEVLFLKED
jgi:hypothetical protein